MRAQAASNSTSLEAFERFPSLSLRLDVEAVPRPVGQEARQEEARHAALGLREHEEYVTHGRGQNHLWL